MLEIGSMQIIRDAPPEESQHQPPPKKRRASTRKRGRNTRGATQAKRKTPVAGTIENITTKIVPSVLEEIGIMGPSQEVSEYRRTPSDELSDRHDTVFASNASPIAAA